MFKPQMLFAAVVLLTLTAAFATPAPAQEASAAGAKKMTPEAHAKAKKLYDLDCALCHGANGDGKSDLAKDMQLTMMDWTDPKSLAGMSDQQLFDEIRKGKGKMPGEDEGRAKNDDVRNLVQYIRKMAKDQAGAPAAAPAAPPTPAATPEPSSTPAPPTAPAPSSR